jgi:bacterioferritin
VARPRATWAAVSYIVYSQTLKGTNIAQELELHAREELEHALIIAKQIDFLGGSPTVTPKTVKTSDRAEDMLTFDLDNENETVRNYKEPIRQCEQLGEFAIAENLRKILAQEQEHQIDLHTALARGERSEPERQRRANQCPSLALRL